MIGVQARKNPQLGLRAVAMLEAGKGLLALLAAFGVLALLNRDAHFVAIEFLHRLHVSPEGEYSRAFVSLAESASNPRVWLAFSLAGAYAAVRFVEAYGLWRGRRWAEWFAAASFAIYVPLELYEIYIGVTTLKVLILFINVAIVGYLVYTLWAAKARGLSVNEGTQDTFRHSYKSR